MDTNFIRPVAAKVYDALMGDFWPPASGIVDFGIDSDEHYAALQDAVRKGATKQELDKALGDGPALTLLVSKYGSNVKFTTSYDDLDDY
jgi:hypothetical protein